MQRTDWSEINAIVVEAALQLFDSLAVLALYGGPRAPPLSPHESVLSVVGFAGERLSGNILLSAPPGLLRRLHPEGVGVGEAALSDWAGELANLLIGRVKRKLLGRGVVILLGVPMTVSGLCLRIDSSRREDACVPHVFQLAGQTVQIRLEAVGEDALFASGPTPEPVPLGEGDMTMF